GFYCTISFGTHFNNSKFYLLNPINFTVVFVHAVSVFPKLVGSCLKNRIGGLALLAYFELKIGLSISYYFKLVLNY
ncbi:MAG: hypothetical protein ACKO96_40855, partial [Flammeovirgaceae bacterium]